MKRMIIALLIAVLAVPAVALAQTDETARARGRGNLEVVRGEIISVTENEVLINTGTKDKPQQTKVQLPQRHAAEFRGLLAQGLGQQAQLRCRKGEQGVLTLSRISEIQGVDVSSQPGFGPRIRENLADGAQNLSPEQREQWRDRFTAMSQHLKDNPELREQLRQLAKDDPEAFRQRIREMMPESHQRQGRGGPQRGQGAPSMPGKIGPPMMGRMMPGQQMGTGDQGRRRFPPESEEVQKLERQTHELARQYRQAQGEEKQPLKKKLRAALLDVFEKKAQHQTDQVEHLEKQLQKLRSLLETRQKNREAIIDQRFEQLTRDRKDELAW